MRAGDAAKIIFASVLDWTIGENEREQRESDLRDTIRDIVLRWLQSEVDPRTEGVDYDTPFSLMGYVRFCLRSRSLVGPGDVVIGDELNHASIVDGCVMSGATFDTFKHNDVEHLAALLRLQEPPVRRYSSLWTGSIAWKATLPRCRASLNFVADMTPG